MNMHIEMPSGSSYTIIKALVQELGGRIINETTNHVNIGKLLKTYRKEYGFTQKQLADVLLVPQSHISAYENGIRKIPYNKATKLAAMFNCPVSDFISYQN